MELIVTSREDLEKLISQAVAKAISQSKPAHESKAKFLTVADVASELGVAPITIYRGMDCGKIPYKTVGARKLIPSSYLDVAE